MLGVCVAEGVGRLQVGRGHVVRDCNTSSAQAGVRQARRRDVLSATTKFLWLKMKSPIIIYDSRARKALGAALGEIDEYYSRWREKFKGCEQQIRDACTSLQKVHEYTENPEVATPQYIAKTAAHPWFRERVFDVYLWSLGTPNNRKA